MEWLKGYIPVTMLPLAGTYPVPGKQVSGAWRAGEVTGIRGKLPCAAASPPFPLFRDKTLLYCCGYLARIHPETMDGRKLLSTC